MNCYIHNYALISTKLLIQSRMKIRIKLVFNSACGFNESVLESVKKSILINCEKQNLIPKLSDCFFGYV